MTHPYSTVKRHVRLIEGLALGIARQAPASGRAVAFAFLTDTQARTSEDGDALGFAAATIAKRRLLRHWQIGGDA